MDTLPVELKVKIIKLLPRNQILVIRLLSKDWKLIVNQYCFEKNLLIKRHNKLVHKKIAHKWLGTNVVEIDFIDIELFRLLNINYLKFRLLNLKSLSIIQKSNSIKSSPFTSILNGINNSKQLENLEVIFSFLNIKCELNLPKLKSLKLNQIERQCEISLQINSPELVLLSVNIKQSFSNEIKFLNCQNAEYLECSTHFNEEEILKMRNLKYLFCFGDLSNNFKWNKIINMPFLKEIHVDNHDLVEKILEDKKNQEPNSNSSPRIFPQDLKLYMPRMKDFNKFCSSKNICHFENSDINPNIKKLEFDSHLFEHLNNQISADFLKKFINLKEIYLESRIENVDKLSLILNKFHSIEKLRIDVSCFKQNFINTLPNLLPGLKSLTITNNMNSNLDFLFRFKFLTILFTDHQSSKEFIKKLFKETKINSYKSNFGKFKLMSLTIFLDTSGQFWIKNYLKISNLDSFFDIMDNGLEYKH